MSTVVFLHAHPDDEALFTGGTMARLAADGVRVVLITATDGAAGLVSDSTARPDVAHVRDAELAQSCRVLGVAQRFSLGYADSGLDGHAPVGDCQRFADADVTAIVERVGEILRTVQADVLVGYDAAGGYGHPDHVKVNEVATQIAVADNAVLVLEATLPREPLTKVIAGVRAFRWLIPSLAGLDPQTWSSAFTPRRDIAYRVNVRSVWQQKRAALAAHTSQTSGGEGPRTVGVLLKLPRPAFNKLLGTEFFGIARGSPGRALMSDSLRDVFRSAPGYQPGSSEESADHCEQGGT